jgi:hypothetical protein
MPTKRERKKIPFIENERERERFFSCDFFLIA